MAVFLLRSSIKISSDVAPGKNPVKAKDAKVKGKTKKKKDGTDDDDDDKKKHGSKKAKAEKKSSGGCGKSRHGSMTLC